MKSCVRNLAREHGHGHGNCSGSRRSARSADHGRRSAGDLLPRGRGCSLRAFGVGQRLGACGRTLCFDLVAGYALRHDAHPSEAGDAKAGQKTGTQSGSCWQPPGSAGADRPAEDASRGMLPALPVPLEALRHHAPPDTPRIFRPTSRPWSPSTPFIATGARTARSRSNRWSPTPFRGARLATAC